ncbi:MAG: hypothetical protein PVH41_07835 [Anaerolineae bacterium]
MALLGRYFIEYRVTLVGSLIGFVYAVVLGGLGGVLVGRIYNRALDLRK